MMQRFEREEIDLPKNLRRVIPHIYTPSTIPKKQLRLLGRDEHFLQHLEHCPKCSSSINSVTLYLIFLVFVVCECLCYVCLLYYILYTELHYLSSHFFFFESRCLKMFLQDMPSQLFCEDVLPFQEVGSPKSGQPFAQGQVVVAQFEERGQRVRNLGKERGRKLQASAALFDVGVDSRLDPNMSAREVPCVHMCRRGAQCQRLRDEFNQSGVSVRVCYG